MNRLTAERHNGIKTGYWSPAKKEELVQALGAYEDTGLTPEEIMDGRMLTGWVEYPQMPPEPDPEIDMEYWPEYIVMIDQARKPTCLIYAGNEDWWDRITERYYPVTAWMPLPEPYDAK